MQGTLCWGWLSRDACQHGRCPLQIVPDLPVCCYVVSHGGTQGQCAKHCSPDSKLAARLTLLLLRMGARGSVVASASHGEVLWGLFCMQGRQSHLDPRQLHSLPPWRTWPGCSSDARNCIAALCTSY